MKNEYNTEKFNDCKGSKLGFATILVLVGLVLLGFNLGFIPIEYKKIFISWQMLLIVFGIISFFKQQIVGGIMFITIGGFFMLPILATTFPETFNDSLLDAQNYWPALLIIAGILFLFKKKNKLHHEWHQHAHERWQMRWNHEKEKSDDYNIDSGNEADYVSKDVLFSSSQQIVFSSEFKGGELNIAFGEIKLDLRKVTETAESNYLQINVMFGSGIIYLPPNWHVNIKSSTMFGDIKDKREMVGNPTDEKTVILNLKASCLFGSVEIRN